MFNPHQELIERLDRIEMALQQLSQPQSIATSKVSDQLLTGQELCKFLAVSEPTLWKWRKNGKVPFVRIGGQVRFDRNKVIAALEKSEKT